MLITNLHSLRVLITRPIRQARTLATQLTACGAQPFVYPVLQIVPIELQQENMNHALEHSDWVIFTSSNAVWHAAKLCQHYPHPLPPLLAIGPATAATLIEQGLPVAKQPTVAFSSEGLLAMPLLQACQNKRILLIGGVGGRTLLTDELTARGASVNKLDVYRRCPGVKPNKTQLATWQHPGVDVVISTSGEGLFQLDAQFRAIDDAAHDWLLAQQLLLMSQRLVPLAQSYGFMQSPLVASDASDDGLVKKLAEFVKQQEK